MIAATLLCALASSPAFPIAAAPPAPRGETSPARDVEVVVEHAGDSHLRDKLTRDMNLWCDAGGFLVGAADRGLIGTLRGMGLGVVELPELREGEELYLYEARMLETLAPAAVRSLYRRGGQVVAAAPPGACGAHAGFMGPVAIERRAVRPPRPLPPGVPTLEGVDAGTHPSDPRVQALVDQVSKANIEATNASLAANYSRNSTVSSYIDAARDQLIGQLQSFGLSPTTQHYSSSHGENVLVEIAGTRYPNQWVVLGAHYDSRNGGGASLPAPGADDNASGSAGVMELARVLSAGGPYERSLRFIWFSGEEYGLHGSKANAQSSANAGQDIVGMINLDMIAYRAPGDALDCDWLMSSTSPDLTNYCDRMAKQYVSNWASGKGTMLAGTSDHASYFGQGFPTAWPFEDAGQHCPWIHTVNDSYPQATNDFDLALMITRGTAAAAASLAEPMDLEIQHAQLADTQTDPGPYDVSCQVTSLTGSQVTAAQVYYSVDQGKNWFSSPLSGAGSTWSGQIPAMGTPVWIRYYLMAQDDQGGLEFLPERADATEEPFEFLASARTPIFFDDFETSGSNGWMHGMVLKQDDWQKGAPQGKAGDPGAAWSGSQCWGNDLGGGGWNGYYDTLVNNWLLSPPINCTYASRVLLEYRRWNTVEDGIYDRTKVKMGNSTIWTNPLFGEHIDTAWELARHDMTEVAAGQPAIQIEFLLETNMATSYGGWNIDDFGVYSLEPVPAGCPAPVPYCTAKQSSQSCTPSIAYLGEPSLSSPAPFEVVATRVVSNKNGVLFYGYDSNNKTFQGGWLCVQPPVKRTAVQSSGGNAPPDDCSGSFSYDFNALIQSGADPQLVLGRKVYAQYWFRDPAEPSGYGTGLTSALQFEVCP